MVGEERRVHDEDVVFPPADGVTLVRARAILWVFAAIHVDDSLAIEKLAANDDPIIREKLELVEVNGRSDHAARRGRRNTSPNRDLNLIIKDPLGCRARLGQ